MGKKGESTGRSLDFLIREMQREANTISSKTTDLTLIQDTLLIKEEIEKNARAGAKYRMNIFPKVKKGRIFVISAPSGTGKTTLVNDILSLYPDDLVRAISCTTREPRGNEKDGIDYHFLTKQEFEMEKGKGEFLETAQIYDYHYGTLKGEVEKILQKGKNALLVIDVQGASQVREKVQGTYIFICPPSHEELERRIRNRKQDAPSMIEKRLKRADEEIKERYHYDYILVNDNEKTAVEVLKSILIAECYKNEEKNDQAQSKTRTH